MRIAGILAASGWHWNLPEGHYLRPVAGEPLLVQAALGLSESCDRIGVMVPQKAASDAQAALRRAGLDAAIIPAGPERWRSIRGALSELGPSELVISHDVCRALASPALFSRVLTEASANGAAACALPLESGIVDVDALRRVMRVLAHRSLQRLQTPQAFVTGLLQDGLDAVAHAIARLPMAPPDEVAAVQLAGGLVHVVQGEADNRELLTDEDFAWAEAALARRFGPADRG